MTTTETFFTAMNLAWFLAFGRRFFSLLLLLLAILERLLRAWRAWVGGGDEICPVPEPGVDITPQPPSRIETKESTRIATAQERDAPAIDGVLQARLGTFI